MSTTATAARPSVQRQTPSNYNYSIGYLRAAIVALVVAHHAALAYHPLAAPIPASLLTPPYTWRTFPVVDGHRAAWAGVFATVNDIFFMALMFFISGLFVWKSLARKGASAYMRDRWLRLGLPFIPIALILAPLSYYPTNLQIRGHVSFGAFLIQFFAPGHWSAGPVWFLWVLLIFDWIATVLFRRAPEWGAAVSALTTNANRRPAIIFYGLVVMTAILYVPFALVFNPYRWAAFGPFNFQLSRLLLYLAYFMAGVAVGAQGLDRGLLATSGRLARRWPLWIIAAVCAYLAWNYAQNQFFSRPIPHTLREALTSVPLMSWLLLFAVSCAASSFAVMAVFVRFANRQMRYFDSLAANSYGIFLFHFIFVIWLGYFLLAAPLAALAKFLLVFAGSLTLSWLVTAQLRRIPAIARII
jgi:surface polysaccharide O-acyltransferase-like enzyme